METEIVLSSPIRTEHIDLSKLVIERVMRVLSDGPKLKEYSVKDSDYYGSVEQVEFELNKTIISIQIKEGK